MQLHGRREPSWWPDPFAGREKKPPRGLGLHTVGKEAKDGWDVDQISYKNVAETRGQEASNRATADTPLRFMV